MPFLAPASIAIFAIVNLSSIVSALTPSPVNSMDMYLAPSTPIFPIIYSIKSLPDTYFLNLPLRLNLIALGTLSHVLPVAIAAAISVEPIPVENAPRAPYVQV